MIENPDRYKEFVSMHSTEGIYDPEKGLEGLLSCLTPDTKAVALLSMQRGEDYFTSLDLFKKISNYLENYGLNKKDFPLSSTAPWVYCFTYKKADKQFIDGSLIDIGAVIKKTIYVTNEGLKTGCEISQAGEELCKPLISRTIHFVNEAREKNLLKSYSMFKILGAVNSITEKRRQISVFNIVKALVENPNLNSASEIKELLGSKQNHPYIAEALISLGETGIINYESPYKEINGKWIKSFKTYSLTKEGLARLKDKEEVYKKMKNIEICHSIGFNRKNLSESIDYILDNPDEKYDYLSLAEKFGATDYRPFRTILWALTKSGYLNSLFDDNMHTAAKTKMSANYATHFFYDSVLLPAHESAKNLEPTNDVGISSNELKNFLANFRREKTRIGPDGGDEIKAAILRVLENEEMKRSLIVQKCSPLITRKLNGASYDIHINSLIKEGIIERTKKGHYKLKPQLSNK